MLDRYFALEDPRRVEPVGVELMLEADIGGVTVRGIIDRLERDADGGLVVTDYKTGRAPSVAQEQSRLGGVHFYAFLCHVHYGQLPSTHPADVSGSRASDHLGHPHRAVGSRTRTQGGGDLDCGGAGM